MGVGSDIETTSTSILKPSSTSPPHPLLDTYVPLTIFDEAAFDLHVATLYAFRAPMPTNSAMKDGLSKVLSHFPHLSGRMCPDPNNNRPSIHLNNAGVRVIETRTADTLADRLPLDPSDELALLHPPTDASVEYLLQVQLNRFACGGLVIGVTSHHRVADGHSMSGFLVRWAEAVRGLGMDSFPYLDRAAVSVPRSPPRSEFNHRAIEFKEGHDSAAPSPRSCSVIENLVVHYSAEFVSGLKRMVSEDEAVPTRRCSTFECLLAHVWKKITKARGLGESESSQVRVAVNGRARMREPAVPMEFFGNLVLWAYPRLSTGEILKESHAYVVKAIHDSVAKVDEAYFRSFIDFGEMISTGEVGELSATAPEAGNSLCPNLEVDSWLRFNFHDLDFGTGGPCAFLPPNLPVEGLLIFVPSCKDKGAVDVFLALSGEHVELFKEISHSLG
ncbi:Agmatine coumaroyltransferase-2 [Acorus gramineus]|uniref:Agmatine coumaroyltransferase-2 n=1 Tax=Acorus gramineus TaxID=55184 RepID=A0AAV9AGJ0_ACOGR|nr:Agmatine coumaroyltransferase-2 [Acorus gramineus]